MFCRALWGSPDFPRSMGKIRDDIRLSLERQAGLLPVETYVFGIDNQNYLAKLGIPSTLLSSEGILWKPPHFWRHKLEVWKRAAADHGEFLFLDFDMFLHEQLPKNFWDRLRAKSDMAAALMQYSRRRLLWRGLTDTRKLPSAAFCYFAATNSVNYTKEMIRIWEANKEWTEQMCMARLMDDIDGWHGAEAYYAKREPHCLKPFSRNQNPYPPEITAKKTEWLFSFKG